ncbi:hypothetical protein FB451DRAFT_1443946 [Mycena latifolia]|nr:hypothetical protein FB451DRAFT_1443946 [Mycena latifolia]
MSTLIAPFPLPLSTLPEAFLWDEHDRPISERSTSTALRSGLAPRDVFLGVQRCLVCGVRVILKLAHIVALEEPEAASPCHTPARRLGPKEELACGEVGGLEGARPSPFAKYRFFVPELQRYVLVDHGAHPDLAPFHGKALALDARAVRGPVRVARGAPPAAVELGSDAGVPLQDWVLRDGVSDAERRRSGSAAIFPRAIQAPAHTGSLNDFIAKEDFPTCLDMPSVMADWWARVGSFPVCLVFPFNLPSSGSV